MAPTPTGVTIGGVHYPAGDIYHSPSVAGQPYKQYIQQNGQYYLVGSGGQITPASPAETSNLTQTFPGSAGSSNSNDNINYSQLLPSAQTMEQFAPLPYQQFGAVPYTQAATVKPASVASTPAMRAAQMGSVAGPQTAQMGSVAGPQTASVDLSQMPGALSSYEQMVKQALAPTFQQQQDAVTADLAKRGIYNSTAGAQLQTNLQGQQDAALASAYEPLISQFAQAQTQGQQFNAANQQQSNITGYTGGLETAKLNAANQQQSNITGYTGALDTAKLNTTNQQLTNEQNYLGPQNYNEYVAALQQQAALGNQQAMNTMNTNNANMYDTVVSGNATNYNNYLNELMKGQWDLSTGLADEIIKTYDPSLAANLQGQGLSNAGNAYTDAYTAAGANSASFTNALGNLATQLTTKPPAPPSGGGADMSNASFGGWGPTVTA